MNLQDPSLSEIVTSGNEAAVRQILSSGADANQTNKGGQTPLILAIVAGHTRLLPLLLEAGANPYLKDSTGLNAIEWAERKGRQDLAALLTSLSKTEPGPTKPSPPVVDQKTPSATNGGQPARSDEKSRKWLAGLRQRFEEKANSLSIKPSALPETDADEVLLNTAGISQQSGISQPHRESADSEVFSTNPTKTEADKKPPRTSSTRKRCPQCNTYYNSELLAYCAYDSVALVDADQPIVPPPSPDRMTPLLWLLVLIVLGGAIGLAYVIITPLYKENQKPSPPAATLTVPVSTKGIPIAGGDLKGKALVMPEAEVSSMAADETAVVIVRVRVDRRGYVSSAVSSEGEDPFRQAAIDAAQKAIFSVKLLRARGAEGTITYTFKK